MSTDPDTQVCTGCGREKSLDAFYRYTENDPHVTGKPHARCKQCQNEARGIHRRNNPESAAAVRRRQKLKRYGLTPEDYNRMVEDQGGNCAICLREGVLDPGSLMRLGVDHNHRTGKVRGLLCRPCNRAIGIFGDDAAVLDRAAAYLRSY